jgi:hypothetical protein
MIIYILTISLAFCIGLICFELYYWSRHIYQFRLVQYKDIFLLEFKKLIGWERVGSYDTYDEAYASLKSNIYAEMERCGCEKLIGTPSFKISAEALPTECIIGDRVLVYATRQ